MEAQKIVKQLAEELLTNVGFKAQASVEEQEGVFSVTLDSEDNALLIGKHGNTLSSIEYVLALMTANRLGEFHRVIVEVGGYRKEREEYLKDLADRLKQEVESTGIEKTIRGLKPWERRLIHMSLDGSEVVTESMGEGRDRVLVIRKK